MIGSKTAEWAFFTLALNKVSPLCLETMATPSCDEVTSNSEPPLAGLHSSIVEKLLTNSGGIPLLFSGFQVQTGTSLAPPSCKMTWLSTTKDRPQVRTLGGVRVVDC
jgi:hypothetical protein